MEEAQNSQEPQPNDENGISDHQRLTAIRLLTMRVERREQAKKAQQQKKRDALTEITTEMNELIDSDPPLEGEGACHDRLEEIRDLFKRRKKTEEEYKGKISKIAAEVEQANSAKYELIMTEGSTQTTLSFGDEPEPWLTNETAREVTIALRDVESDGGGELPPDMEALRRRVDEMGLGHIQLVPEEGEGEDDGDEEPESE